MSTFVQRLGDAMGLPPVPRWWDVPVQLDEPAWAALDRMGAPERGSPRSLLPGCMLLSKHERQTETFAASLAELCFNTPATYSEWTAALMWLLAPTESPIEWLGIAAAVPGLFGLENAQAVTVEPGAISWSEPEDVRGSREWTRLTCQKQAGSYRVDLAVEAGFYTGAEAKIAVEFDGHDFHERTKEQAERDRSRDRALQIAGWSILRFTGRELYRDPFKCGDQVQSMLWTLRSERTVPR